MLCTTQDTALDWVRGLGQDFNKLQERIASLQATVANLGSSLDLEVKTRVGDIESLHSLHDRLSQKAAAETEKRCSALEQRASNFESKAELWVAGLGKANMAAKDHLGSHDAAIAEREKQHASIEERLAKLEEILPSKCTIAAFEELAKKIPVLREEVEHNRERDLASVIAVVKETNARMENDFRAVQERLDRSQYQIDTNKRTSTIDLSALSSKVEALEVFAHTRAKATDVQMLESKLQEVLDRSLETVMTEVSKKASSTIVTTVSERLTNLCMEVQANQARAQGDVDALGLRVTPQISALEQNLLKTERQLNNDREAHSACWVALEKELSTKAVKTDVDALRTKVNETEAAIIPLVPSIATKAAMEELVHCKARIQALEEAYPTKADAADVSKMSLVVSDHVAKHDTQRRQAEENTIRIEKLGSQLEQQTPRFDATEKRTLELGETLKTKAELGQVYMKDGTETMLKDFYRKTEVDAMLSRIWMRVGPTPLNAR